MSCYALLARPRRDGRGSRLALALSTALVPLAPVTAQTTAPADGGDVIVTALRRNSTVQDTPLAITAISGESLANPGVTNIADVARLAPGLRIQDNGPGQRRLSLRGILSAGEPTVGVYYDETPTAGNAEYRFTRDIMVYGLVAEGNRPGGANQTIGLPASLVTYGSDKLWDYELGAKTALFGRRLYLDAAAFTIDWTNMQVSGTTPNGFYSDITNVGASRVRGAELELSGRPGAGLNLFANLTYLDAHLTKDQINDYVVAAGRKGDRIPFIPYLTATAGAELRRPVSTALGLYARLDGNCFGESYLEFRPTNPYRVTLPAYAMANARLGLDQPGGRWGAYLFVSNLTSAVAINRATRSAFINSFAVTSATPRAIGLNLRTRF